MIEIASALEALAARRPVFHSEGDFQHALAWELQQLNPNAQIRLEVPLYGLAGRGALDIVVRTGAHITALELKYFKASLDHTHEGERYQLPATIARDIARHDVCKDIHRIEHAIGSGQVAEGFVVVITNDPGFWRQSTNEGIDEAFKIHDGRQMKGTLTWSDRAGSGTTRNREAPIDLHDEYEMKWWPYSNLGSRNGEFKALIIPVFRGRALRTQNAERIRPTPSSNASSRRKPSPAFRQFFANQTAESFEITLAEIEALRGSLPPSAYKHQAWWSGNASHPQAVWELEGYRASPRLSELKVTFRRRLLPSACRGPAPVAGIAPTSK